jgi:Protein of unknown function (DUF4125)
MIVRHAMTQRDETIAQILEIELEMFLTVNGADNTSCQEHPDAFKLHRRAQFAPWSLPTLRSYLDDLDRAQRSSENLMTLKYARMEGLVPRANANPLIDEIVRIGIAWQAEMICRYPALMSGARPLTEADAQARMTSFETYARGENETYSDRTLELLHADMRARLERGANMSEEVYASLVKESGYTSLDEAERLLAERHGGGRA